MGQYIGTPPEVEQPPPKNSQPAANFVVLVMPVTARKLVDKTHSRSSFSASAGDKT